MCLHFRTFSSRHEHCHVIAVEKYLVQLVNSSTFGSRLKFGNIFQYHVYESNKKEEEGYKVYHEKMQKGSLPIKATKRSNKFTVIFHDDMHPGTDGFID